MADITWVQPYYHIILDLIPRESKTILDVGAGYGIFGYILKKTRAAIITSIEPFYNDLPHDINYKITWDAWLSNHAQYHDVVVATEFIEHLEKSRALHFLEDVKKICNKSIIATPLEFEEQPTYDGNLRQIHQCLITEKDFMDKGYKVIKLERNIIGVWEK